MKTITTKQLTLCGIIAALYAAITVLSAGISFLPVQLRLAEALCLLPFLLPISSWGCFLGCLLANAVSTVSALDLVVGSLATLLGCRLAGKIKNLWLAPIPIALSNAVLVGALLSWVYMPQQKFLGFVLFGGQLLVSESIVLYGLGIPFIKFLIKSRLMERLLGEEGSGSL